MPQEHDPATAPAETPPPRRKRRRAFALVLLTGAALGLAGTWFWREDIAENLISGELAKLGLPATYEIVNIGPSEQVVRNLVIGDPRRPDLTVEEIRVATRLNWGWPGIGRITVVRPRLFGTLHGGRFSLGSLDKVLHAGEPSKDYALPDLDVAVEDGRALIESDYGRIAARLAGKGGLRGGFDGELAALSPHLAAQGCEAGRTTLYGRVRISGGKPRFTGPLRFDGLACPKQSLRVAKSGAQLDVTLDRLLDGGEGRIGLDAGETGFAANRLEGLTGSGRFTYRRQALTAQFRVEAKGLATPQARLGQLAFDGSLRSANGLARFDLDGDVTGKGVSIGESVDAMLVEAARAGEGTLAAPVATQVRSALARETRGSTLDANLILRRGEDGFSLVVPRGHWRGASGASLLALSRLQAKFGANDRRPVVTGNFASGGQGLPQVSGRMESDARGHLALQVEMPEYRAGDSRVALPHFALSQTPDGTMSFTGETRLSGALPGGAAQDLVLPIDGRWGADGTLAVWPRCTTIGFGRLAFANLTLDRRSLQVCPARGGSILRSHAGGFDIAAGVPALDVSGHLGETPIRVASGPLGYAQFAGRPGALTAKAVDVSLGPREAPSRFRLATLDAQVGKDIGGAFDEADISLAAVPLDLKQTAGNWRYSGGVLAIDKARFTLVDRQQAPRFQPLVARDGTLRLENNVITAQAVLREPTSDREMVRADVVHDLGKASGHADLAVSGITFDKQVQAETLSPLLLGIVSNLEGSVHGTGRIDWNGQGVTSHGRFATDGLDFAAAFGPVKGLSGDIAFTDLLGFVTAPDQKLKIASINPGVEVTDGELSFQMEPGYLLRLNGARWPFMSGTLTLDPATMRIGASETRHYKLNVSGLDAATFVQHLELTNINATGVFDGEVPLVFDEQGGRIVDGYLASRDPGGNVSYLGALTYKDLSAMGNFAFGALKSVDYRHMEIGLGGSISGELLTRISFDGLSQGTSAQRNFITKQIAKLPIRFVVKIKAPFFKLFGSMRSLYDPTYVTDPRAVGIFSTVPGQVPTGDPGSTRPAPATIQPPVSENNP
ncbi:YdbH domain-containing protein [Novosphingobium aerophilum]|uniref:YdbH domain-containing protein n=1 Tax=Novosphingobium TaxID=165696 RepID=UPI002D79CF03|nr:YdbH domain-containing protein [Novosphingobium sp. RL4]WRT94192.1 YdbH domain-containing protein [Novosphingobium sp. RL4]